MIGIRLPMFILLTVFLIPCSAMAEEGRIYTLDEILSIAVEKNPSIVIFRANLEAGRGAVLSAAAYPNPEIELGGGMSRPVDTGGSNGNYSIGIGQPIEWPGKRLYRKKAAEAEVQAAEKDIDGFGLELRTEVKKAFYQLLLNKKAVETAKENSGIVFELLKTVEVRVRAGESPEFELVKAKVETLRADKELKKAGSRLAVSRAVLNALLGNSLRNDFDIDGAFKAPDKKYGLQALLSTAMEKHPFILKAKREAEAKSYFLEMEKASVFPGVAVKGFFNKETDKDSYGLALSIPIPLWYQRKGEIASAAGGLAKAEAEIFKTRVELSKVITEEFQNYTVALDQIEVFEKGLLRQSEEALRIADLSYRQGESGLLDFLDAQRVYLSTLIEYYQSFFELESSLAALERAAGGLPPD